jgi:hypothetical protein
MSEIDIKDFNEYVKNSAIYNKIHKEKILPIYKIIKNNNK